MMKHKRKLIFITSVAVLFAYLMLGTAGLVSYLANRTLAEQGLNVNINKIRLNPFAMTVEVSDVLLTYQNKSVLELAQLSVETRFGQLVNGNIAIAQANIADGKIVLNYQNDTVSLGGWLPSKTEEKQQENNTTSEPLNVFIQQVLLSNINVELNAQRKHQFVLQQAKISDSEFSSLAQRVNAELVMQLNNEPMKVTAKAEQLEGKWQLDISEMQGALTIDHYAQWIPEPWSSAKGQLTWNVKAAVNQLEKVWSVELASLTFNASSLAVPLLTAGESKTASLGELALSSNNTHLAISTINSGELSASLGTTDLALTSLQLPLDVSGQVSNFSLDSFNVNAPSSSIALMANAQGMNAKGIVTLAGSGVSWIDATNNDVLLKLAQLDVTDLDWALSDALSLNIPTLSLGNGEFSTLAQQPQGLSLGDSALPPLAKWRAVNIANIAIKPQAIAIEDIKADIEQITVVKTKEQPLANLTLRSKNSNEAEQTNTQQTSTVQANSEQTSNEQESESAQTSISLGSVEILGVPNINYYDYSLKFPMVQQLKIERLWVKNIVSQPITTKAEYSLLARMGKRAAIDVAGQLTPFDPTQGLSAKGTFTGVDLTQYSPFIADAIGHNIKQGMLNAKIDFAVDKKEIKGKVDTHIKAIALSPYIGKDDHQVTQNNLVPLNLAIGQLTDDKGNLDIDIPLSGNLDDPDIGLTGIISLITTKAMKEGAKSYLMQTFVPYANIVSVAMMAGGTLFAINVDDLKYPAEQVILDDKQKTFADQLAQILIDKPKLQITACPVLGKADGISGPVKTLADKKISELKAMGQQRFHHFVDYLVDEKGIASDRIVPCASELSTKKAQGHLSFSIK